MMGRNKIKFCPDCTQNVATSSSICSCGGSISRRTPTAGIEKPSAKRRRTERIKRGKPDFYDALEYEKQAKKKKKLRTVKSIKSPEKVVSRIPTPAPVPNRMQLTVKKVPEEPEVKEEELEEIVISEEKAAKFALILNEINRKICASSWKGYLVKDHLGWDADDQFLAWEQQ